MRLLIDLGNTRFKWALSKPPEWRTGAMVHRDRALAPLLEASFGALAGVREVWACSVAQPQTRETLATWCAERWSVPPRFIAATAQAVGVRNGYRDPAQLGADRWAALIGARAMSRAALTIVDCGTAITIDALSADSEFVGGVILPGLALQRAALAQGAAALGVPPGAAASCQARSTAEAIGAGTLMGIVGAIERIAAEHRAVLGEGMEVLLTGGDAAVVAPHLRCAFTEVPDLVLRGLERIATC
jgi:type III pantothenate kinase